MKPQINQKQLYQIYRTIDSLRMKLRKLYNIVYEDKNGKSLHTKFINDEILPSSKEGEKYMKSVIEMDILELQIVQLAQQASHFARQ